MYCIVIISSQKCAKPQRARDESYNEPEKLSHIFSKIRQIKTPFAKIQQGEIGFTLRTRYDKEFKAKAALEAFKGEKTI